MSYFAVELGRDNLYVAVEQLGPGGRAEPRVLQVEQAAGDGLGRLYRHALPAAVHRDEVGLRVGEQARRLLLDPSRGNHCIREELDQGGGEDLAALLRYLKQGVERSTGRAHSRLVLVGVEEAGQMAAASLAAAAGLEVAVNGFVDWLEAALLDMQHSPPHRPGPAPGERPWLLVLDIGHRATGAALLQINTEGPRLVVGKVARADIPWGCRDIDRALARPWPGDRGSAGRPELAYAAGLAREEIIQLLEDGVHPDSACASAAAPGGVFEISAADLDRAVGQTFDEGLRPHLWDLLSMSGGPAGLLLVGGGARCGMLASRLQDTLDAPPLIPVDPELALVRGAILSYAIRSDRL